MPTTLTGLLLFVVLLLPGFGYLVGKERTGTERRMSPFRETVSIVAASVTCELIAAVAFAALRALWPSGTPNVGELVRNGGAYLRGGNGVPGHYAQVALWAVGLLVFSVALAYGATLPLVRGFVERRFGPYPHVSTVSAWWILFRRWPRDRAVEIACTLDDGSQIRGMFGSFNIAEDDSPDRDLILRAPIRYRPPGDTEMHDYDVSAVCVAARNIVAMFVSYTDELSSVEEPRSLPAETGVADAHGSHDPVGDLQLREDP
jgi:hypothetical protein